MKIDELVRRAMDDDEYMEMIRELAYKARDEGMKSRSYTALCKLVAETPSDLRSLKSTIGYVEMLTLTTSKNPTLCRLAYGTRSVVGIGRQGVEAARGKSAAASKTARAPRASAKKSTAPARSRTARS